MDIKAYINNLFGSVAISRVSMGTQKIIVKITINNKN
jgi:hypothetical protein